MRRDKVKRRKETEMHGFLDCCALALSLSLSLSFSFTLTWTRLAAGARRGTAEAAVAGAEGRAAVASAGRAAKRDAIAK